MVVVMMRLHGRLAIVVRLSAANLSRHSDRGAAARKNGARIRRKDEGQNVHNEKDDDARKERARQPPRLWPKLRHGPIVDTSNYGVNREEEAPNRKFSRPPYGAAARNLGPGAIPT
jgi:hypothetical protein